MGRLRTFLGKGPGNGSQQLARPDRPRVPRCREWRGLAPWGREGLSRQTRPGCGVPGVGSGAWWRWGQAAQPLRVCSFNVEKRHLVHFIEEALRPNTVPPTPSPSPRHAPTSISPLSRAELGFSLLRCLLFFLKKKCWYLGTSVLSNLKLNNG